MQSIFFFLKKIIFLNFILFTLFAGEGSGCDCGSRNESNTFFNSSPENSSGEQSSDFNQGKDMIQKKIGDSKVENSANFQEDSTDIEINFSELFTEEYKEILKSKAETQNLLQKFFKITVTEEVISWAHGGLLDYRGLPFYEKKEHLIKVMLARIAGDIKSKNIRDSEKGYIMRFKQVKESLKDEECNSIKNRHYEENDPESLMIDAVNFMQKIPQDLTQLSPKETFSKLSMDGLINKIKKFLSKKVNEN